MSNPVGGKGVSSCCMNIEFSPQLGGLANKSYTAYFVHQEIRNNVQLQIRKKDNLMIVSVRWK